MCTFPRIRLLLGPVSGLHGYGSATSTLYTGKRSVASSLASVLPCGRLSIWGLNSSLAFGVGV